MCGIAGMFRYPADRETRVQLVNAMGGEIQHRGPDDSGHFADEDITLGMQRLSIIDLPGGHQPMSSDDGVHLVFNGEIYNYRTLQQQLAASGEQFRTRSDTEVILHQYRKHGLDGFQQMNGMFAVAIWDARSRSLHLVRDRMGVKPLYYFWDGSTFAFASEIKALLALPAVAREIEPHAIWDYLTFRYVPGPRTLWRHIFKLPPAHRLTISAQAPQPQVSRWWDIPTDGTRHSTKADHTAEFGALFTDAVNLRMVADVPVGITLSGGIDSSAVAAVAAASHPRVKTFSVAFAGSGATDERRYARMVATHLGTDHAEVEIGEREFLDFLPSFVRYSDEPVADLASVPLYYVCRLARHSVKVALSGEGADEILAGYDFERWWAHRATHDRTGGDVRRDPVPPHMTNYMSSAEKRALFRAPAEYADSLDVLRGHLQRGGMRHPLDQMLYLYCQDWLVEDLLMKADRMSMANSLELRTPFLDYRLVEWAARAPIDVKIGHGRTKQVLRRFAEPLLPADILTRPKQGFPVPVYGWLAGPLRDRAHDLVLGANANLATWFDRHALEQLVARGTDPAAATHDRHRLWHMMILEYWFRAWCPR